MAKKKQVAPAKKTAQMKKKGKGGLVSKNKKKAAKTTTEGGAGPTKPREKVSLQEKMARQLQGGQFRSLNEELYTNTGAANFARFSREPDLAQAYHRGFREQAKNWPTNPLDTIIASLRGLARCRVADFGCGDARLAAELASVHSVASFDLVANSATVVACNMERTPLAAASVDVAVFCLALMGPSWRAFLAEARRVLRPAGLLKIAEVRSRFDEQAGGMEAFVDSVRALGFDLVTKALPNKIFVTFDFRKTKDVVGQPKGKTKKGAAQGGEAPPATSFDFKPCLYKRR